MRKLFVLVLALAFVLGVVSLAPAANKAVQKSSSHRMLGEVVSIDPASHTLTIKETVKGGEAKEDRTRMRILDVLGLLAACLGLFSIPLGVSDSGQHRQLRLACIQVRHDPLPFRLPGNLPRTTAMVTPTLRLSSPTASVEGGTTAAVRSTT